MAAPSDNPQVELIRLAREIALAGTGGSTIGYGPATVDFLKRFRAAFSHLGMTVDVGGNPRASTTDQADMDQTDKLLEIFAQDK